MMKSELIKSLQAGLASSTASDRKVWSDQILADQIPLDSLFSIFHSDIKTIERFTWLIGDLSDHCPEMVAPSMPFLFELHDQLPFPGIKRSVAKWLWKTKVPKEVETEGISQLLTWMRDPNETIGCKSYSAKAIFELAESGRLSLRKAQNALAAQLSHSNSAFVSRMRKVLQNLETL